MMNRNMAHARLGWATIVAIFASLMLLAAACGNGNGGGTAAETTPADDGQTTAEETTEPTSEETDGAGEATELTVALLPTLGVAPVQLGVQNGYFEDEGVKVTTEMAFTGVTESLVAGEFDIVYSAHIVPLSAVQEGLPLRLISEAERASTGEEWAGVLAMPDSGIESPEDFEGKTLGAPTVAIGKLIVFPALQEAGVDTSTIEVVEVPFPNMLQALESGNVDLINVPDPLYRAAQFAFGAEPVFDPSQGEYENFPVAGYWTTEDMASNQPDVIAAFKRGLARAVEEAEANPDALRDILPTFMEVDEQMAQAVVFPDLRSDVGIDEMQLYVQTAVDLGLLEEEISMNDIVVGD